jgi:tripartite-type tricarboxylate transporter receptor subunit TctC
MLPMAFVVNPSFPASTAQELTTVLKANPGKYGYASPGIGTMQHLAFEAYKRQAGVDALHVPYKGAAAMMPDLMSGQVPIGVISAAAALGPARAGKLRALAVTSPERLPTAPDWPALAETLPGFSAAPNVFLVGPPGISQPAVSRLSAALRQALAARDVQESFARQGATTTPGTPEALRAQIADEVKRWAAVVKEAGVKAE